MKSEDGKTKVLKVIRERKGGFYELFEYSLVSEPSSGFDLIALNDIGTELWDVPEFFRRHARDLLLGQPVSEKDPSLICMRLPQPVKKEVKFLISYSKRK